MPGTVLSVKNGTATVDFHGNVMDVRAGLVDVTQGDRVLVHAGCIIQTMSMEEEEETWEMLRLIEDI